MIGFASIFFVSLITIFFAYKNPKASSIILFALFVRIFILLLGEYFIELPDSTRDSKSFEYGAWKIAEKGFYNLLNYYPGPSSSFIEWLIAIPYSIFGRSVLMAKSISLFFGVANVFLGWKIANQLWGSKVAIRIGWLIAIFPSLILYSSLIMRESYICFFHLVAIYGVISWAQNKNFKSIFIAITGFTLAAFFHGASFIGVLIFLLIISLDNIKIFLKSLKKFKINLFNVLLLVIILIFIFFFINNKISLPYLNNFEFLTNTLIIMDKTNISVSGNASYPEWTIINNPIEFIYKVPLRSLYFLFSPFPWDVKKFAHLIGIIDSLLYLYLTILILKNFKFIWKDKRLRIILIILLCFIAVFAIGVGNFGTGIRHRSKFAIIFILLAGPMLKKLNKNN